MSIAKDLTNLQKRFSRLAGRTRKKMDPDDLHDLRVLTRRLRALIWLSQHSRNGPGLKRLRKKLRDLGHALGERRTLDVLAKDARRYGMDGDGLKGDAKKARDTVLVLLSNKRIAELDDLMTDAASKLEKVSPRDLDLAIAELIVRLEELQRQRPHLEKEWHRLRIEVKKIRYASELLGLKAGGLKQVQDLLGRGHDLCVLMERLGHKRAIETDMRKFWNRTKRVVPSSLSRSEKNLLSMRK